MSKSVLVTGAARGIGLATTKRFLADGWRVALLDIDGENLARTFAALNEPERFAAAYRKAGGSIDLVYIEQAARQSPASYDVVAAFFHKHLAPERALATSQ